MSEPTFEPTPEPTEAVETEPVAAEPESWAPDRNEYEQMRQFIGAAAPVLGQVAQYIQAQQAQGYQPQPGYQQPQQPQPEEPNFDPFEPQSVQAYIEDRVSRGVEEVMYNQMQPYAPLLESVAATEGERIARATLSGLGEDVGAFDEDAAMILGAGLMSQGSVSPEHALRTSAMYLHQLEARIREDERARVLQEQGRVLEAPGGEHPVAGSPAVSEMETVPTGPRRYQEALERALARRNAGLPIG